MEQVNLTLLVLNPTSLWGNSFLRNIGLDILPTKPLVDWSVTIKGYWILDSAVNIGYMRVNTHKRHSIASLGVTKAVISCCIRLRNNFDVRFNNSMFIILIVEEFLMSKIAACTIQCLPIGTNEREIDEQIDDANWIILIQNKTSGMLSPDSINANMEPVIKIHVTINLWIWNGGPHMNKLHVCFPE